MRRIALCLIVFMVALTGAANAADAKVGVVDMDKVFRNSESGKKALKELEDKFKPMSADLEKKKSELDKMRDDLQKQGVAMSADAKKNKENEFQKKVRDYQDLLQNSQRTMKGEEDRLAKPIIESVFQIIKDYGKKNKFTMIIEKNAGLLFYDDAADLTSSIISELNKK